MKRSPRLYNQADKFQGKAIISKEHQVKDICATQKGQWFSICKLEDYQNGLKQIIVIQCGVSPKKKNYCSPNYGQIVLPKDQIFPIFYESQVSTITAWISELAKECQGLQFKAIFYTVCIIKIPLRNSGNKERHQLLVVPSY